MAENSRSHKKRGRPGPKSPLIITPAVLEEISDLSKKGLTQEQIHDYYGICNASWYKLVKLHPEITKALRKGRSNGLSFVVGKLFEKIEAGNLTAINIYLRTRAGWSEYLPPPVLIDENEEKKELKLTTKDPVEASKIYQKLMRES